MSDQAALSESQIVRAFVTLAIVEAITWAALLTGMYFKHAADTSEIGVQIAGPIHGIAFIGYVTVASMTAKRLGWSGRDTALAIAAAFPPFGTVVFERWAARRGLLDAS